MSTSYLSAIEATKLIKSHIFQGSISLARRLFDELPHRDRDVVAWTTMISGYTSAGLYPEAWTTFRDMVGGAAPPNAFTLSSAIKACEGMRWLAGGAALHAMAVRRGIIDRWPYVENTLLHIYSSCSDDMVDGRKLFDEMSNRTAVSWTSIIAGYTRRGDGQSAVQMFGRMIQEGVEYSPFTCSIAISACALVGSLTLSRQIHGTAIKLGLDASLPVANSLVDMYSRCMSVSEAKQLFSEMPRKDLITWNGMIAGLQRSLPHESLQLLLNMGLQDIRPNSFTLTTISSACASLAVLNCGRQVHGAIIRRGFEGNLQATNALIDMYAKCGCVAYSKRIFNWMPHKDLFSWTSMMIGYGTNGYADKVIDLFNRMIRSGVQPDHIVFTGVINACSHAGLVEEGMKYFNLMRDEYNILPDKKVYGCAVDLLGRAGRITEAYALIETMPFEPDESIWGALLGACKMHNNVDLGRLAAKKILDLKPKGAKTYIILSNIFAASSEWREFADTRKSLRGTGSRKDAGRSWIEVRDKVHNFVVGDANISLGGCVYGVLAILAQHMDEARGIWDLSDKFPQYLQELTGR